MKKYYFTTALKIFTDFISVPFIIILAYSLKFKIGWIADYLFNIKVGIIYPHAQIEPYLKHVLVLSFALVVIFFLVGVYRKFDGIMYRIEEALRVLQGLCISIILLLISSFIYNLFPESRSVMVGGGAIALLVMMTTRKIIESLARKLFPSSQKNIVTIGASQKIQVLLEGLSQSRQPYNYVGTYVENSPENMILFFKNKFKHLGPITEAIFEEILSKNIQAIYVDPEACHKLLLEKLILFCEKQKIEIFIIQKNNLMLHGAIKISECAGVTMLSYPSFEFVNKVKFIKRLFDILFSIILLICLSPCLLFIACWIKCVSSNGSIIYKQERVGKHNSIFNMYKFRTMIPNAEENTGPTWVAEQDNRYIFGGKILRRYSLDELPQLFNILFGNMSIVGPRPERPFFVDKISKELPHFPLRHVVKGGLTGWAQIHGRSYMTNKPSQKIAYDIYYITHWSFILDLKIMIKTVFVVLKGDQAY